ncbi:response regulator [Candidatus Woesearchaeota archaeon]|nr:response regulator [Candidatus Woesearchaeota archaeon]
MGAENDIMEFLRAKPEGASITEISGATGHTRATAAKYLEMMNLQNRVAFREIGKAKLWAVAEKRKKILIAEDEEHIRRLVKAILGQEKYDIIEAKDGREALEKVSEEMPDLIILDLMMPKVDGIEVCRQLKSNALTKKIPIIMLTAKTEMTDKIVGIKAGADDYLTKPFEPNELRVRVKTFVSKEARERNQITNLPTFYYVLNKLKKLDGDMEFFYLFFKNLEPYKKNYGYSKTNELIRLASQMITHSMERLSNKNFVGHDEENNFVMAIDDKDAKNVLDNIQSEFKSTIPFFYDIDYESIDLKKNVIVKTGAKGKIEQLPLIQLEIKKLDKGDIGSLSQKLKQIREG